MRADHREEKQNAIATSRAGNPNFFAESAPAFVRFESRQREIAQCVRLATRKTNSLSDVSPRGPSVSRAKSLQRLPVSSISRALIAAAAFDQRGRRASRRIQIRRKAAARSKKPPRAVGRFLPCKKTANSLPDEVAVAAESRPQRWLHLFQRLHVQPWGQRIEARQCVMHVSRNQRTEAVFPAAVRQVAIVRNLSARKLFAAQKGTIARGESRHDAAVEKRGASWRHTVPPADRLLRIVNQAQELAQIRLLPSRHSVRRCRHASRSERRPAPVRFAAPFVRIGTSAIDHDIRAATM